MNFLKIRYFLSIVFVFLLGSIHVSKATHLMGGSMTYEYTGMVGPDQSYRVTLKIYRYCDATGGGTAPLDFSMNLGVYFQDPLNPNNDKDWYRTEIIPRISNTFITPPSPGVDCSFNTTVCVEEGIYEMTVLLPPSTGGYHLIVERCCRNGNIVNLSTPGSIGQSYYCFIPADPILNSSPQFSDIPVPFICAGDTVTIVNNAFDPDGDSLVYSFETPYSGYSSTGIAVPDPQFDSNPYIWPITSVLYNPGYSVTSPFGAGGYSNIDNQTGLTQYYIPNQGFYVVAIEIKEYRNGVLIASVRRDLQLLVIACPPNAVPVLSAAGGGGVTSFTVTEGQTICFPVSFVDPNGDSLYLTSSGNIFNVSIINPPASLPNANGDGFVTSQFCWSTECGQAQATPYQFIASVIDNGCPPKITSQIFSIKVNPSPLPPAPAVSITQSPPGSICTGTDVTFTAIPTFGGTNPIYQWQLNGVNVGVNSNTYTSSTLVNGDIITVSLISNSVCVSTFTASSPPVVMVVNPFAAPSVSIAPLPTGPICAGTNVTFTATPVNPGATPTYQWSVNGVNVGSNSPVFSSSTLTMAGQVSVTLMSDPACPPANSNIINMVVNPVLTPSVTITSDNAGAICPGQLVTFQAFPTNGGTTPSYQWQVNGVNAGTNSNLFSSTTLNNGDNISVILTSNGTCVTTPTATSNVINILVTAPTAPTVSITVSPAGPICAGDNVIFTASPSFGGSFPTYQWQINGINTGATGSVYATAGLTNGAQVRVIMTSNLSCVTTATATSNVIAITVNPTLSVSASITISPSANFCAGSNVTFTATANNGGTTPAYQWQVNGINSGTNSNAFTTNTLVNLDKVRVIVTSNQVCVSPVNATSNQITVNVTPVVTPSVTISANPAGPVCDGTPVIFTATPVDGGITPAYQWTVNGSPVGSNNSTYTSNSLTDGDIVRVVLTSSIACPAPASVNSNQVVMDIIPLAIPSVSITSSPVWPVCDGTTVTFTATIQNGGTAPSFLWRINGITTGGNTPTLTVSTLVDGDSILVRLISNEQCASPVMNFSNVVVADVLPYLAPVTSISALPGTTVCAGDSIHFSAVGLNGGNNPTFQWILNGNLTGSNNPLFSGVFNNNDSVRVIFISDYECLTIPSDTSNFLVATVFPNLVPSISLAVNPVGAVCPGDLLTFTSTPINGGTSPVYQWQINGLTVPGTGPVYSSTTLNNGDIVRVRLTSSETCVTSTNVNSNQIAVQISPNITPGITISVSPPLPACDGDSLTFTAVYTGGGALPVFRWRINGVATGSSGPVFGISTLANNDVVDIVMESSAFCALPLTDTSNAIVAIIDPLLTPTSLISANPPGTFCDGQEIIYSNIGIFGGLSPSYQWFLNGVPVGINNDTLISSAFLDGDSLQLQYTSTERCLAVNPVLSNLIIIDRLPPLQPQIFAPDEVCEGLEVMMGVTANGGTGGPYYYSWDNGFGSAADHIFIPGQTATYTVTVIDSCSTPRTVSKSIIVNPLPEPDFIIFPPSSTILNPYFEFKDISANTNMWLWQFGDGNTSGETNPEHEYLHPGYYNVQLVATSADGCVDSIYRQIFIEDVVAFYIPNSFTPNGDGVNDEFGLVGNAVSGFDMEIYNRWGQIIYRSNGSLAGWNGKDKDGKESPQGVYIYTLKVFNEPKGKTYTGTVSLVR